MMSATPVPSKPLRRIARAAAETMRSCEASLAAVLALCFVLRMTVIIHHFAKLQRGNVRDQGGAQPVAARHGLMQVRPDTSPRNTGIAEADLGWDFGTAAG